MRKVAFAGALAATIAGAPLHAGEPASRLSFRDLEYAQPRDPLTGSNPAYVEVHHSPADQLAIARAALEAAVPPGTGRQDAERRLHAAGAKCKPTAAGDETCTYHDVETVDEYLDDITWKVQLTMNDDKVQSLSTDRSWQRH